ncbi:hypothetical protein Gorai_001220, partial [Gossypium raimondii]|nr:hypothetical protein [Gossypium raimondii]
TPSFFYSPSSDQIIKFGVLRDHHLHHYSKAVKMIDDQDLGFFANFLGIFIFVLVIAYHYVMADPKFEGN